MKRKRRAEREKTPEERESHARMLETLARCMRAEAFIVRNALAIIEATAADYEAQIAKLRCLGPDDEAATAARATRTAGTARAAMDDIRELLQPLCNAVPVEGMKPAKPDSRTIARARALTADPVSVMTKNFPGSFYIVQEARFRKPRRPSGPSERDGGR